MSENKYVNAESESVFISVRFSFEPSPAHTHKGACGREKFCAFIVWLIWLSGLGRRKHWSRMVVPAQTAELSGTTAWCCSFAFMHNRCPGCKNKKKKKPAMK